MIIFSSVLSASETVLAGAMLLIVPAVAVLLLWGAWLLVSYALRNASESPLPPDENVRNWESAFSHTSYRVTVAIFFYSLFLISGCLYIMIKSHVLIVYVGPGSSVLFNFPPPHSLSAIAFHLFLVSILLSGASFLTLVVGTHYGKALTGTWIIQALWLIFGGFGVIVGAGLSVWLIPSIHTWIPCCLVGGLLFLGGLLLLLHPNKRGVSLSELVASSKQSIRKDIVRDLEIQGVTAVGEYRGESYYSYWTRIAAGVVLPIFLSPVMLALLFRLNQTEIPRLRPNYIDGLVTGFVLGMIIGGVVFLTKMQFAYSVKWEEGGLSVQWYWQGEKQLEWDEIAAIKHGQFGTSHTPTLLVIANTGDKFVITGNGLGYSELSDVLILKLYSRSS